ncbi:sugar transferase [Ancylomarina sp.]|uniref:sugar transferase n=1 Tax=Ancylomarina sp. TaxID=1970196 RepID=UPI0035687CF3
MNKRILDIFLSTLGLFFLFPVLIITSVCIVIESGFPIFFRQCRVGKGGADFYLLKFRTMNLNRKSEEGSFDAGDTSRVTSVGRFLRRTKLDELPQLLNVLSGEMSLVGPRPEVRQWVKAYPEKWKSVHKVKPGITDNASILFRNEEEILASSLSPQKTYREVILPKKLSLYLEYVKTQSLAQDCRIIFKTLLILIRKK